MSSRQSAEASLHSISHDTFHGMAHDVEFTLLSVTSIQKQSTHAVRASFDIRITGSGAPWARYFNGSWPNMVDNQRLNVRFNHMTFLPDGTPVLSHNDAEGNDEIIDFEREYQVTALLIREGGTWRFGELMSSSHGMFVRWS